MPKKTPKAAAAPKPNGKPEPPPVTQPAEPEPQPEPLPEWATSTPRECEYDLTMFGSGGDSIDDVDLSRAEYIDLKRYLASTRYPTAAPEAKPEPEARHTYPDMDREEVIKQVRELDACNLWLIATAAKALERSTGATTPAEEFIDSVLMQYGLLDQKGRGMTPADLKLHLEAFSEDFDSMLEDCAFNVERYPQITEKASDPTAPATA